VSGVTVTLGSGTIVGLQYEKSDHEWGVVLGFSDLASLKAEAHGVWIVQLHGAEPSVSTFTLEANSLDDADFFECPQPLEPIEGATVASNVVCTWTAPSSGPFPALYGNPWIDYFVGTTFQSAGPSGIFGGDILSWDPPGCLEAGCNTRLGLAYIVPIDFDLISPVSFSAGAIEWETPSYAPPGYPANAPLVALAGQTRIYFNVAGLTPVQADLNCDGIVNGADLGIVLGTWGPCATCSGDINSDGVVDGADLGIVLGSWTG